LTVKNIGQMSNRKILQMTDAFGRFSFYTEQDNFLFLWQ
jgi:hypothetical protein